MKRYFMYDAAATDGAGGTQDEVKTVADGIAKFEAIKKDLETKQKETARATFNEEIQAVNTAIEELKQAKPEVTAKQLKDIETDILGLGKSINILSVKSQNTGFIANPAQPKTFNDVLSETIMENANEIKGFKRKDGEKRFEMKAVGDMSIAANFTGAANYTVDIRNGLIDKPYNRVWLGDILPQGTTTGSSIIYPKENGGEGGAAVWTDPTTNKAQMDFDFTTQSAYVKWIAGWVVIAREMLDDIDFLNSYLRNKMLISLKIAENDFVLNGTGDSNPVQGILDVATAYDGSYLADIDRIIDAAYGQIPEDTFDFYSPTNLVLTHRDGVSIALNKAAGSGEYDLPNGSTGFANGNIGISNLQIVNSESVGQGNFVVFDRTALMFIKRMQPELRMFEDATLAKKNQIMFRVEERATLAIFNNQAIVKGTITGPTT